MEFVRGRDSGKDSHGAVRHRVSSHVRRLPLLEDTPTQALRHPYKVALGGKTFEVKIHCSIQGAIEGLEFHTEAVPIDEVGTVDGKKIDVIIGALTMDEWEIIPNPKEGTLDLSGLRRREFTEFLAA